MPRQTKVTPKSKISSHTDDGTPIVNVTLAQIRKGQPTKKGALVRIPQVAERSKCYEEAAKVIGEREALALPYHGGRMWKCEVKLSDAAGAHGSNFKSKSSTGTESVAKGRKSCPTPLFRWYRHSLQLATLPHLLEGIVEVSHKMGNKKKWINLSNDDDIDSSDEEWEEPLPSQNVMEISTLTTSAYEDSTHPLPTITRSWISPDLQRFNTRKAAIAHSEELVERDLLIDRILFGYGKNGVRLRPVKPTRKAALEAGMARFLRDGLWIVGQEEMWIEKRREIYNRKTMRLLNQEKQKLNGEDLQSTLRGLASEQESNCEDNSGGSCADEKSADDHAVTEDDKKVSIGSPLNKIASDNHRTEDENDDLSKRQRKVCVNEGADSTVKEGKMPNTVSPNDSDASLNGVPVTPTKLPKPRNRLNYIEPLPPSTHYRLNPEQIDKCYAACIEHYERVMFTVKARSLHHELSDGFDVLRERGKGRYDMELPEFDTDEYSFLTDAKMAAWMPIIHKILGEDAILVHKGCFLSLPGSETQVYHQDGVHLNNKFQKPCHAVNVFIPLVDYDMTNGPTEFCLGSHYLGHENFVKDMVGDFCCRRIALLRPFLFDGLHFCGTPVIFDYRLGHRGLRNYSQNCRPVVYLTYSSVASGKEFRDSVNFSRKRYRKLGEFVEKPLSREERAKRRRFEE
ncbi:hypothetical protein HJC23_003857 [Cyclotella cryptica]|uniref:Uncharacterized protein n=1 Tax=Cyclotella cryptica TaxID=29204 RepID=A0ABD3PZC2_9STRA